MSLKIFHNATIRKEVFFYTTLLLLFSIFMDHGLLSAATAIFVISNILFGISNFKKQKNPVYFLLILFYLFGCLSWFWSQNQNQTLVAISRELSFLIVPLALFFSPKLDKNKFYDLWKLYGIFLNIVFLGLVVFAFKRYNMFEQTVFFFYHDLTFPLELNAIFVSFLVSVCLLILCNPSFKKTWVEVVIILINAIFLILLSSKLILVLTVLGIVMQWLFYKINWKFIVIPVAVILVAIAFIKPIQERFANEISSDYKEVLERKEFNNVYYWRGTTLRLLQSRIGVEILNQENAWIGGVGLGASQELIRENQAKKKMYHGFGNYNFHNQYMQILVELGLIGLAIYFLIIGKIAYDFRQNIMVLSIILLIFGLGLTESFLWRQRGLISFLIIVFSVYQFNLTKNENAVQNG